MVFQCDTHLCLQRCHPTNTIGIRGKIGDKIWWHLSFTFLVTDTLESSFTFTEISFNPTIQIDTDCTFARILESKFRFFPRNNLNLIFANVNDMIGSLNSCVLIGRFWDAFHAVVIRFIIRVALTAIIIGCGDAITIFAILFLRNSQIIFDRFAEISWNSLKYHFSILDSSWWP